MSDYDVTLENWKLYIKGQRYFEDDNAPEMPYWPKYSAYLDSSGHLAMGLTDEQLIHAWNKNGLMTDMQKIGGVQILPDWHITWASLRRLCNVAMGRPMDQGEVSLNPPKVGYSGITAEGYEIAEHLLDRTQYGLHYWHPADADGVMHHQIWRMNIKQAFEASEKFNLGMPALSPYAYETAHEMAMESTLEGLDAIWDLPSA